VIQIINDDCLIALRGMADNSVDSVVTDPPYGISFMNKHWDYDVPSVEIWKEVLRVLKPGGHILCACGTRTQHRMTVNIEDAGFEIRDVIAWIYGSGFPKSLNVGKAIDSAQGKERELVGVSHNGSGASISKLANHNRGDTGIGYMDGSGKIFEITKGNSEYEGWGTALKPACEYWTLAYKPFSIFKKYAIFTTVNNTLLDLIWQSLENLQEEDTSNLLEMGLIPLNTALLWHSILEEVSISESKFTISTELKLITELKILNSLLSRNTQENTDGKYQTYQNGMNESQANGFNALATTAGRVLEGLSHIKSDLEITRFIVTEIASLREKNTYSFVPNVEINLKTLNESVNFVLHRVLINLITEENNSRLSILVNYAEKLLQQSLQEIPNIAVENVWQKHLENIQPELTLWTLARKPLSEKTVATNVLKWGTGGINIDGCRVETDETITNHSRGYESAISKGKYGDSSAQETHQTDGQQQGRFPANVIHDGSEEVINSFPDAKGQCGDLIGHDHDIKSPNDIFGIMPPRYDATKRVDDSKSASRFFYCAKASKSERNKGLDEFNEVITDDGREKPIDNAFLLGETQRRNNHPTVKPVSLMRYLCRMITPLKGIILDPYMGSGSTGIGAKVEGFNFIGIERESEYCKIAQTRIDAWKEKPPKEKIIEPTLFD